MSAPCNEMPPLQREHGETPLLDRSAIERQTGGDPALIQEVAELFSTWARERIRDVPDGDFAARGEAAHALRGAALAMGAERMAERMGDVERDPECEGRWARALDATSLTLAAVDRELIGPVGPVGGGGGPVDLGDANR